MKKTIIYLNLFVAVLISINIFGQKKQNAEQYNTIENTRDKITIGIGMIVDTPSQVSCQYAFYSLLDANPILTSDKNTVLPVLTLKRGLTSYFVEGIYSSTSINLKLWQKGTLLKTIQITPTEVIDDAPSENTLKQAYNGLTNAINGTSGDPRLTLKKTEGFKSLDKLVDKDVGNIASFIYASAINYTPDIKFRKELYNLYSQGALEIEYQELKELKGNKFKYKSLEEYVEKIYPELAGLFQTPSFMPKGSLEQAQMVQQLYKIKRSDHFFFTSKFVDDRAKIACRKVVFPLWRRPGTAITYLMAAENFMANGYTDAAIEAYYSALLVSDALTTYPNVAYFIKAKIYKGLSEAQLKEGNSGSAAISENLAELYNTLVNSNTVSNRLREYKKLSNEVSSYFLKIEQTSLTARSEKKAAFWNTLTSVMAVVASAANDGAMGLETLSPETQSLINVTGDNIGVGGDYKTNSLIASSDAAKAFTATYGEIVKQLQQTNNETGVGKPFISTDFMKRLIDNDLSQEKKDAFLAFSEKIPAIKNDVHKYLNGTDDSERKIFLQDIYKKMATMELTLAVKESMGENPGLELISKL